MKVIAVDNLDRESFSYPDKLVKAGLSPEEAQKLADQLNKSVTEFSSYFNIVVEDNRELFRFHP